MSSASPPFFVHVTRLPASTTESSLRALLGMCESLLKVDLRPDRHAPACKHAYVSLSEATDAQRLVTALKGLTVNECTLEASLFNPRTEEREDTSVHVKGLLPGVGEAPLREYFQTFGAVLTAQIGQTDQPGAPGFGFVQFESPEAAAKAIQSGGGNTILGPNVRVEPYIPKQDRKKGTVCSVYVRGFDEDYGEARLKETFARFGDVQSCSIMKSQKLFGFVNFQSSEAAERAIKELHGNTFDGVKWYVCLKVDRRKEKDAARHAVEEEWSKRNLFICGLPPYITDQMVASLFSEFGEVESLRVQNRASYSFEENAVLQQELSSAYVCYKRAEDAERALTEVEKMLIDGRKVHITKWKPIESRRPATLNPKLAQWLLFPTPTPMQRPMRRPKPPPKRPNKSRPVPPPAEAPTKPAPFDLTRYQGMSGEQKKAYIGEAIYWELHSTHKNLTGKLTGMILEMPEAELLALAQDSKALLAKAVEAVTVLKKHVSAA